MYYPLGYPAILHQKTTGGALMTAVLPNGSAAGAGVGCNSPATSSRCHDHRADFRSWPIATNLTRPDEVLFQGRI
jgi:hypothetical protein